MVGAVLIPENRERRYIRTTTKQGFRASDWARAEIPEVDEMSVAVLCHACGALVLQTFQAQHAAFHQHHGHVESIDFTGSFQVSSEEPKAKPTKRTKRS